MSTYPRGIVFSRRLISCNDKSEARRSSPRANAKGPNHVSRSMFLVGRIVGVSFHVGYLWTIHCRSSEGITILSTSSSTKAV